MIRYFVITSLWNRGKCKPFQECENTVKAGCNFGSPMTLNGCSWPSSSQRGVKQLGFWFNRERANILDRIFHPEPGASCSAQTQLQLGLFAVAVRPSGTEDLGADGRPPPAGAPRLTTLLTPISWLPTTSFTTAWHRNTRSPYDVFLPIFSILFRIHVSSTRTMLQDYDLGGLYVPFQVAIRSSFMGDFINIIYIFLRLDLIAYIVTAIVNRFVELLAGCSHFLPCFFPPNF